MRNSGPVDVRNEGVEAPLLSNPLILAVFTVTLLLSALLLFIVQPMFAKMVLPRLGGSPAVWSVAMCFFQLTLLAGYAYAHALGRIRRTPQRVIVHLLVLVAASLTLPLGIAEGWDRPPEAGVSLWVLALFAASIGLPFFALSANAPLLQAWFARTGHPHADDPYFLYGASNVGSLLALLAYPLIVEPYASLTGQSHLWSAAFHVLIVFVGISGLMMLLRRSGTSSPMAPVQSQTAPAARAVTSVDRLTWMGLAFVPSGLLVAVTAHISTDVAAVPLLWVLPLALFLLTFVITFQKRPIISHKLMLAIQPAIVALLIVSLQFSLREFWIALLVLNLGAFFVNAMVCHGELVRRRPQASHLTEFYLYMSLGGALGGLFTSLIAPQIFSTVLEYPVMIVLALAARPGMVAALRSRPLKDVGLAAALLAAVVGAQSLFGIDTTKYAFWFFVGATTVFAVLMVLSRPMPLRLAAMACAALFAGHALTPGNFEVEHHRGFFGVNKVVVTPDKSVRLLSHGTTLHGAQKLGPELDALPPDPLTYYHFAGPFADVINAVRQQRPLKRIGAIGLGTGSLACYRREGESWTFFEIDPLVVKLARDPKYFRFLSDCAPEAKVVVGDARLTLAEAKTASFDLIVLDAFSSDSIPVHLLTREALQMYVQKLSAKGVLLFHVSNKNMDLMPVVGTLADTLGLAAFAKSGGAVEPVSKTYKSAARVIALARSADDLGTLPDRADWKKLERGEQRVWSDDYSNVLAAIMASLRGAGR